MGSQALEMIKHPTIPCANIAATGSFHVSLRNNWFGFPLVSELPGTNVYVPEALRSHIFGWRALVTLLDNALANMQPIRRSQEEPAF